MPGYGGSSPHTRGAPRPRRWGGAPVWDHPRIRGEHTCKSSPLETPGGSSPHTRGARRNLGSKCARSRIIPAYAGSTGRPLGPPAPGMDHPRIRGEHASGHLKSVGELGSSPHTRGARLLGGLGDALAGIIPAYAGSTKLRDVISTFPPDHPRIRGEHPGVARAGRVADGSSPHTRGAL